MFFNPFTRKGFARGLAKLYMKSLHQVQRKYPDLSKIELYTGALGARRGFTEPEIVLIITQIIDECKEKLEAQGYTKDKIDDMLPSYLNFQKIIYGAAILQYIKTIGHQPSPQDLRDIEDGITSVIPYSL
jgi:hypothetical protein